MADKTQRNHQELCLLYENAASNLAELKKKQWQAYVFYSAIIAVVILPGSQEMISCATVRILVSAFLLVGAIVVEFAQTYFRHDILVFRKILIGVYGCFGYAFREVRKKAKGEKKANLNAFEKIFRHGGSVYIFSVLAYFIAVHWKKEVEMIDPRNCLPLLTICICLLFALLIPLIMDECVRYIIRKSEIE
jgi:hypothetical protein